MAIGMQVKVHDLSYINNVNNPLLITKWTARNSMIQWMTEWFSTNLTKDNNLHNETKKRILCIYFSLNSIYQVPQNNKKNQW